MTRHRPIAVALTLALALSAPPAPAQILGGGLPALPSPGLPGVGDLPRSVAGEAERRTRARAPEAIPLLANAGRAVEGAAAGTLAVTHRLWAERLLREHPDLVEADPAGAPAVRGEILAIDPSPSALESIRKAGFEVRSENDLEGLGLRTLVLAAPAGVSTVEAVRRLRTLDPQGGYEFNHLYSEGGAVGGESSPPAGPGRAVPGASLKLGLVDGSVAAGQPSLAGARLVQKAFAPGGPKATPHATAVASLMVGAQGRFRGAAPGATLYVADVYGPTPTGGSASAVARGLAWMAEARVPVINISLVGPPNALLAAAVRALAAKGHIVVAAAGNDGPAAPPLYPAAYPEVVAVTAVDARRRILPEAGRGSHVDFAAPGSDLAAGGIGGGFVAVRGTSFAAPLAAGRLARLLPAPDAQAARAAVSKLAAEAQDLGARGPDPVYGRGLVAFDLRTDPSAVGARRLALRP